MKKISIIYWTTTILFAAFMTFSAVPDILMVSAAKVFMTHLGYPEVFYSFYRGRKINGFHCHPDTGI